jgi:hypothetical protein
VPASAVNTGNENEQQDEEERNNDSFKILLLLGIMPTPRHMRQQEFMNRRFSRVSRQKLISTDKETVMLDQQDTMTPT